MRKSEVAIIFFGLLIMTIVSAGCVPLPPAAQSAGTPSTESPTGAGATLTVLPGSTTASSMPSETPASGTSTDTIPTTDTPVAGPTSGVSTSLSPTATAATEPPPAQGRSVTLDDNGKTVTLQQGERFLLNLGEGYNWDVSINDHSVVNRVIGVLTIRGSQGLFEARQPGTTALTASGDPTCRSEQPACATPSQQFEVQLVVTPASS